MSTDLIGLPADERHACSDDGHLPNCYNPRLDLTACVCGALHATCRRGHDLTDPNNVSTRATGRRRCRICERAAERARRDAAQKVIDQ